MASRSGRTVMEVWSFSPPPEDHDDTAIESALSTPGISSVDDRELAVPTRRRTLCSVPPPIPLSTDSDALMPDAPS
ncbi:unnamed protein product [Penicillium nalgiovense]|nr:unnamed protein product [Penicillium nalgiovense]